MSERYLIQLETPKGAFYWNGSMIYTPIRQRDDGVFRPWGWLEDARHAQRYQIVGLAKKTAKQLYTELSRLYPIRIRVVGVSAEISQFTGVAFVDGDVHEIGDCLRVF